VNTLRTEIEASMPNSKPILLVEDDDVDVMVVKRTLRDLGVTADLVCTGGGEEALAYLADGSHHMPCVILLDLNMPKMDGFEFLTVVKADETLKNIPVVVVTTSADKHDRAESFERGAAAYVVKCLDYAAFRETFKTIEPYVVSIRPPENLDMARLSKTASSL
jgi:CheY-like chemotaxis protein